MPRIEPLDAPPPLFIASGAAVIVRPFPAGGLLVRRIVDIRGRRRSFIRARKVTSSATGFRVAA